MFEITVCVADFITLSAIFIVCFFFLCVCDCVNQQAPKGPNTFIGKKLLKSQFLKVQTLCLMVKSCQIQFFHGYPGVSVRIDVEIQWFMKQRIYIYIYPSLPKAILNLVFV